MIDTFDFSVVSISERRISAILESIVSLVLHWGKEMTRRLPAEGFSTIANANTQFASCLQYRSQSMHALVDSLQLVQSRVDQRRVSRATRLQRVVASPMVMFQDSHRANKYACEFQ